MNWPESVITTFNATAIYVGLTNITVTTDCVYGADSDDTAFDINITTNVTLPDIEAPQWQNNMSNTTTVRYNDSVWLAVNWTDDVNVSYSVFSWNGTT